EEDRPPHPERDALVRLLLERGTEPYDAQVIYNTHFHGDVLWLVELMYARAMALGRAADWADPEWSMLSQGNYGCGARWFLDIAGSKGDARLAEWCLTHGASANAPPARDERFPQRALHVAGYHDALGVAELLLARGAEIDPVEASWGNTPLAAAAWAQHQRMIDLFARDSRDVWELTYAGKLDRLRDVLAAEPERA